jgi:hypothetical protein
VSPETAEGEKLLDAESNDERITIAERPLQPVPEAAGLAHPRARVVVIHPAPLLIMQTAERTLVEFYDKVGHKVADELVDWFNKADTTYRSEFRELFELHFARLDGKMKADLAALESRLIRWMVGLWVGSTLTLMAAMVALVRL